MIGVAFGALAALVLTLLVAMTLFVVGLNYQVLRGGLAWALEEVGPERARRLMAAIAVLAITAAVTAAPLVAVWQLVKLWVGWALDD